MASRYASQDKPSGKLSITPTFSASQVHRRLEQICGARLPKPIARAIIEEGATRKIRRIGNSLSKIISHSGANSDEVLKLFKEKAYARLLARLPKALEQISKSSRQETKSAFLLLGNKDVYRALAENPQLLIDAFSQLASLKGHARHYAFKILNEHFPEQFAQNPLKIAKILSDSARILGRRTAAVYDFLEWEPFKQTLLGDMRRLVNLADVSCYINLFQCIDYSRRNGHTEDLYLFVLITDPPEYLVGIMEERPSLLMPNMKGILTKLNDSGKTFDVLLKEGKKLAREAGLTLDDREIFLNFAYAQRTIGKEKTLLLNREFGLEYFARYTKEELESLCGKTGNYISKKIPFLFAHAKYDSTGAFYRRFHTRAALAGDEYYDRIFIEAETEGEFYMRTQNAGMEYFGIVRFQIAGHGEEGYMQLGAGEGEEYYIDLTDKGQLEQLHGIFAEGAMVFLDSCSTGKSKDAIGAAISGYWGAELFAPKIPTLVVNYDMEGKEVTGINYVGGEKAKGHFLNGLELNPLPLTPLTPIPSPPPAKRKKKK